MLKFYYDSNVWQVNFHVRQVHCHPGKLNLGLLVRTDKFKGILKLYIGWVYEWLGGYMVQWMGLSKITKSLINHDLIEIIQICLKIYDSRRHSLWVGGLIDLLISNH